MEAAARQPALASKRVLVVDDDPSIRLVLEHALASDGYHVTTCDDGTEVSELIASNRYDLIVLDLYMPGMNGFEVLRQLREPASGMLPARRTASSVKVLVISAHSDEATTAFVVKQGADASLAKPFDLTELLQTARSLLAPRKKGRRS